MSDTVLEKIYRTVVWLEDIKSEDFSLNEMADMACLSPHHFSRVFVSLTGMSPALYFRRRVLTKAAQYLEKSQDRILEVALDYGYDSQEAFARAFKKMFKCNPGDIKKHKLELAALYQNHYQKIL